MHISNGKIHDLHGREQYRIEKHYVTFLTTKVIGTSFNNSLCFVADTKDFY